MKVLLSWLRDFAPIEALDDDCMMELARENAAAAE